MTSPLLQPVFTLSEYAKGQDLDDNIRPLIEAFAESSDVMRALPFTRHTAKGPYVGTRQAALPASLNFRAINAPSTAGAGALEEFQESTYLIDHDIPVDRALVDEQGSQRRKIDEKMAMARAGELWIDTFIKGDNTTTNTVFNGLQKRSELYGRIIDNSDGAAARRCLWRSSISRSRTPRAQRTSSCLGR